MYQFYHCYFLAFVFFIYSQVEYDYIVRKKNVKTCFFVGHIIFCSVSSWPTFPTFTCPPPFRLWNPKSIAWKLLISSCRQTTNVNSKFAYGVICACLLNWPHCITVRACTYFPGINVFLHFSMFHKLYILRLTDISLVLSQLQGILCTQILTVLRRQKRKNPTKESEFIYSHQAHEEVRNEN